jgi:ubiquitin carboxyl-terminal hydrolase 36/42
MNATLQCLASAPALAQSLPGVAVPAPRGDGGPFDAFNAVRALLREMHGQQQQQQAGGRRRAVVPRQLARALPRLSPDFRLGHQEDAHEFFISLLHNMEGGGKEPAPTRRLKTAAMARVFGGAFRSQLTCPACGFVSGSDESWSPLDLQLSMVREGAGGGGGRGGGVSGGGGSGGAFPTLEASLAHFGEAAALGGSDKWTCGGCKAPVRALKQLSVLRPPLVLPITLKRWGASNPLAPTKLWQRMKGGAGFAPGKITAHMAFPLTLRLAPVLHASAAAAAAAEGAPTCPYDLHGVLVHRGFSPQDGHYVAYVKDSAGKWWRMDDSTVTGVGAEEVLRQSAYMLYYSRVPPPGGRPRAPADAGAPAAPAAPATPPAAPPTTLQELETVEWRGGAVGGGGLLRFTPGGSSAAAASLFTFAAAAPAAPAPAQPAPPTAPPPPPRKRSPRLPKFLLRAACNPFGHTDGYGNRRRRIPQLPDWMFAPAAGEEEEGEEEEEEEEDGEMGAGAGGAGGVATAVGGGGGGGAPAPRMHRVSFANAMQSFGLLPGAPAAPEPLAPAPAPAPAARPPPPPPPPTAPAPQRQAETVVMTGKRRSGEGSDPLALAAHRPALKNTGGGASVFGVGGWDDAEGEAVAGGGGGGGAQRAVGADGAPGADRAEWNDALDQGRRKKVKVAAAAPAAGGHNPFQAQAAARQAAQSALPDGRGYVRGHA